MKGLRRLGATLAALAAVAVVAGCQRSEGAPRLPRLAAAQKIDLGRIAGLEIERRYGGRADLPAVQAYVRSIGERVVLAATSDDLPYSFVVLDEDQPMTFALPSGAVYVTRGLLAQLTTEGQLAALLAHQLAHIAAGHAESRLSAAEVQQAADALGRSPFPPGDDAARQPGTAAVRKVVAAWLEMQYNPEMEAEADRRALDALVAAGYHPGEMIQLVALLDSQVCRGAAELARTHRGFANRVADVRLAASHKYPDRGGRVGRQEYQREVLDRLQAR